ncbi:MAG: metallophosphoesterase [Firmicutes bacterium]|nr:metallophosphoesterase [Bacillota bacterium]
MIFGISDLHLSLTQDKPMDIFGDNWIDHHKKIADNWREVVSDEDLVLIPGDVSWAMKLEDAYFDLEYIAKLPGKKVLIKGNHDLWWSSVSKLRSLNLNNMFFIQNDSFEYENISICGSRGWLIPEDGELSPEDEKIYNRELIRLENSLKSAKFERKVVLIHHPPIGKDGAISKFIDIMERYGVERCVYGHIHNRFDNRVFIDGKIGNIEYNLLSCDYLNFSLLKLL